MEKCLEKLLNVDIRETFIDRKVKGAMEAFNPVFPYKTNFYWMKVLENRFSLLLRLQHA